MIKLKNLALKMQICFYEISINCLEKTESNFNDVFVFFIKILRNISSNIVNLDIVGVLLSEFDRVAKEPPSCHQIFIHILLNDA